MSKGTLLQLYCISNLIYISLLSLIALVKGGSDKLKRLYIAILGHVEPLFIRETSNPKQALINALSIGFVFLVL